MAIDFPASPTHGQTFSNYVYDASIPGWRNVNSGEGIGLQFKSGLIPMVPTSVNVGSGSASVSAGGLVTFSGASSVSLNGVFNATYRNYRIIINITSASTNTSVDYRFRAAASDWAGGSGYIFTGTESATAGGGFGNRYSNGQSVFSHGYAYTTYGNYGWLDIYTPYVSGLETSFSGQCMSQLSSGNYAHNSNGRSNGFTSSADGFTAIGASATISGTYQVYGYN